MISFALLFSAAVFEAYFVGRQFQRFGQALQELEYKTREQTAHRTDAESVRILWEHEKRNLHIMVPHNDISYIDYWLGEAVNYIETNNYSDALSKIEVLRTLCEQIPQAYSLALENIF